MNYNSMRIFFLVFFYVVSIHLFAQLPDSVLFKFKQVEQELKVAQKSFLSRKESERIEEMFSFKSLSI